MLTGLFQREKGDCKPEASTELTASLFLNVRYGF